MSTKEFPKDKYGYEIPRCHHVSSTGSHCNAPPMTGEHFCYSHNPRMAAEREEACPGVPWAQRAGGRNRRQPEPPPRIPPNLPYVKLESRAHIQLVYEVTLNYVLQGQMDLRVANTIGYLAMGALATLDSQARADRQAAQDAEKAAEKAAKKAAEAAEKAAQKQAEKAAEKAPERAEKKTENQAQKTEEVPSTVPSANGFVDQSGRKQRILYPTRPPDPSSPPPPPGRH